jgi:dolichol-phosphate mannosyltransferase
MAEEVTYALTARQRVGMRLRRHTATWWQLVRFGAVGTSGYLLNLLTFWLGTHVAGLHYGVASALAAVVAITNNFNLNRRWTFAARDGHAGSQAARFLLVSTTGFLLGLSGLWLLIEQAGLPALPSQALAVACVAPLTFILNKRWTFKA